MNEDKYIELLENGELYDYITDLEKQLEDIRNYIKQSDLGKMLWGKELMKILDREE